jgi:hypothetical protein
MLIKTLNAAEYASLVADGKPIKEMREGVKVWRLPDGRMVKLFRPRRLLSRTRLFPGNQRFARNAEKLTALGFETVVVQQLFYNQQNGCLGVVYPELPGRTLEQSFTESSAPRLTEALARLLVNLHQQGVLFRSLHLGNIVLLNSGSLALIDIEEVRFSSRSLGVWSRVRNFHHLLRRQIDRQLLTEAGFDRLADYYRQHCGLSAGSKHRLVRRLTRLSVQADWP